MPPVLGGVQCKLLVDFFFLAFQARFQGEFCAALIFSQIVDPTRSPKLFSQIVRPTCGALKTRSCFGLDSWIAHEWGGVQPRGSSLSLKRRRCSKLDPNILFTFLIQCYYPHTLRESVSTVCEICFILFQFEFQFGRFRWPGKYHRIGKLVSQGKIILPCSLFYKMYGIC